jgi:CPA1 family monovalent cation:H+ antiporter
MRPTQIFELVLFLMAVIVVLALAARRLNIPTAVAFVIGGIVLALAPGAPTFDLDPDLTLVLFLPPLLMSAAFFTVWRDFRANLRSILSLAVGAVAFTTFTVGWVTKLLIPDLPWAACFTLGAIVSPPDAVAAGSILERLNISRRLLTVLEGESLVNDATGLVLYRFGVAATMTGVFNLGHASAAFVAVSAGGIAIGLALGWVYVFAARRLRDTRLEIAASILIAWTTYIAAERVGASGVLATVCCGLYLGWVQHEVWGARTRLEAKATWSFVVFVLESLVFIQLGLSLHGVMDRLEGHGLGPLLAVTAAVCATVILSRFVWVYPAIYVPRLIPWIRRRQPASPPFSWIAVSYAGMRGVVSLAAALALPEAFPGRDEIVVMTFGVILVTVLIQAPTLGPLIAALGLAPPRARDGMPPGARARAEVSTAALNWLEQQTADPLEGAIARDLVGEYRDRATWSRPPKEGDGGARAAERHARLTLRLRALEAARAHLLQLRRAGDLHDDEVRLIEEELDLDDLRFHNLMGTEFG